MPAARRREVVEDAVDRVRGAIGSKESREIEQEAMDPASCDWRARQHVFGDESGHVARAEVKHVESSAGSLDHWGASSQFSGGIPASSSESGFLKGLCNVFSSRGVRPPS